MRDLALALLVSFIAATPGSAQVPDTAVTLQATAMVKRGRDMFETQGPEATLRAISAKETAGLMEGGLHPFVFDLEGVNVANGGRTALIGKNMSSIKDQDGKYPIREMIEIARGSGAGWVEYTWPNAATRKLERKTSYVERVGDYLVGVGVYRPGG